jgi:hypothetical protein
MTGTPSALRYSQRLYLIQLGEEPNPLPGAGPDERLQCYVGRGARVLHPAFAIRFEDRERAKRIAARFPLAELVDIRDLMIRRVETVAGLASRTLANYGDFVQAPLAERQRRLDAWAAALKIPDARCPIS